MELTNTDGDVKVIDQSTGKQITVMTPGSLIRVEHDGTSFLVAQHGIHLGSVGGPVFFRPTSAANLFQVEHIRRVFNGTKVPLYRDAMEVGRGATTAHRQGRWRSAQRISRGFGFTSTSCRTRASMKRP